MLTIGVWIIAICETIRTVKALLGSVEEDDDGDAPVAGSRRHRPVFAPLACGVAAQFEGRTGPCARRRNHGGRCVTDEEIEHLASTGPRVTVTPLAEPHAVEFGETEEHSRPPL